MIGMADKVNYTLAHVGINADDREQAAMLCRLFGVLFGWKEKEGNSSFFADKGIEIMKEPYLGTHGHIAIGVNDMQAAMSELEAKGIAFDPATRKTDAEGNTKAIYLQGEYCGFALHLVQV